MLQIEELEKKVVKQNLIATKVKQANCSKQLQKQIDTLEMRLYNVSQPVADLWRPSVKLTFWSGQRVMVQMHLVDLSCIKDVACSPGLIAPRISQRLLQTL